jgi:branched-chain amino acid transport system ATP-binding protein
MNRALTLEAVSKKFGSLVATDNVSLTFEPGKIYGLIGPNGAGKSTLINLISGALTLSSGSVRLGDTVISGLAKHMIARAGIARTYQNVRLFDHLSAIDNLEVALYPSAAKSMWKEILLPGFARSLVSQRKALCQAVLEKCGIAQYADTRANLLPYGRQRILEIARALVADPAVLLLDEPAAGLNHGETEELKNRLRKLHRPDRVMIIVEHDMDLIMSLCDHIYVLNFGQLLFSGTPAQVRESPVVQEAYLGTSDELESVHSIAESRKSIQRLRANADIKRH